MLTFYSDPVSLYCAKLRITFRNKGLPWEEVPPPGGYGSDEYRAIVPSGNLPALVDGDLMLSDSEAIAEYLDEAYPQVPMMPDTVALKAKAREQSRFHDTRLEPALRVLFPQIKAADRNRAVINGAGETLSRHLKALELLLSLSPLPRDSLWLCDTGFVPTFEWIEAAENGLDMAVHWPDAIKDFRAGLQKNKAVAEELEAYKPVVDGYMAKFI